MNTREVRVVAECQCVESGTQPKTEPIEATRAAEGQLDRYPPAPGGESDQRGCWWHHVCFDAAQQGELY